MTTGKNAVWLIPGPHILATLRSRCVDTGLCFPHGACHRTPFLRGSLCVVEWAASRMSQLCFISSNRRLVPVLKIPAGPTIRSSGRTVDRYASHVSRP